MRESWWVGELTLSSGARKKQQGTEDLFFFFLFLFLLLLFLFPLLLPQEQAQGLALEEG
jgi:hypothetical protein